MNLLCKVAVNERLVEGFSLRDVIKALLDDVLLDLFKVLNVLVVRQLVHVDPMGFVAPQSNNVQRTGDAVIGGKDLLNNIQNDVTEISTIMSAFKPILISLAFI